jgi:hypothetical protein
MAVIKPPPSTITCVCDGMATTCMVAVPTMTPPGPALTACPPTEVIMAVGPRVSDVPPITATDELTVTATPPTVVLVGTGT